MAHRVAARQHPGVAEAWRRHDHPAARAWRRGTAGRRAAWSSPTRCAAGQGAERFLAATSVCVIRVGSQRPPAHRCACQLSQGPSVVAAPAQGTSGAPCPGERSGRASTVVPRRRALRGPVTRVLTREPAGGDRRQSRRWKTHNDRSNPPIARARLRPHHRAARAPRGSCRPAAHGVRAQRGMASGIRARTPRAPAGRHPRARRRRWPTESPPQASDVAEAWRRHDHPAARAPRGACRPGSPGVRAQSGMARVPAAHPRAPAGRHPRARRRRWPKESPMTAPERRSKHPCRPLTSGEAKPKPRTGTGRGKKNQAQLNRRSKHRVATNQRRGEAEAASSAGGGAPAL